MKIFTLGNGFIANHLSYGKITNRINNENDIINIIDNYKPDVLVNCIGFCGSPNIDQCEQMKEKTNFTNTILPGIIANQCEKQGIHLIQIGSGCIYFGKSPNIENGQDIGWKENDFANPKSYYSKTKYACDLILGEMKNVTTLRIRMPISSMNNGRGLLNKLIKYKEVIDIPNSVTFVNDLVRAIDHFSNIGYTGIYHVVNSIPLSAAKIMKEYSKLTNHSFAIIDEERLDQLTSAKDLIAY